jgi:UDP-N-acetylmuramate dehydrogenase
MNAGAYKREFKDIVAHAKALDRNGTLHELSNEQLGFAYRHSQVPNDWIFTEASLCGDVGDPADIQKRMQEIQQSRKDTQPIREKTGGSTFANPTSDPKGRKAWQLIDAAGCRGLRMGHVQVSDQHCNFLINTGSATATEIEALGEEVRRRVQEAFGIELRWEIRRVGVSLSSPPAGEDRKR